MLQTNKHTRYKKLTKLQNTISRKNHGIIKSKLQKHKKTKLQTGGFIGLDYIKLKWKIRKFNKVIAKMNAWDKLMKVDAESYELSVKEFEDQAQAMARHYTEFTETYRQQIIFKIFEKDNKEAPKAMEAIRIKIDDSKKQLDTRMLELEKRINALNKIVDREVPEFTRLTKAFEKKTKKFQKIATHFSELSGFQEKIKELRRAYDLVSGSRDIKEVGEAHRKKKAKYEKYKADYNRILELTDQEMQNRTEVKNKIETLLETAEYYKSQFGFYEGNKRVKMGKLGLDFKSLKCEKNKSKLCMWADYYSKFADNLIDVSNRCGSIDGALGNIIQQLEICVKNLNVVFTDYDKPPEAVAVIKVFNDIMSIKKETFAKISSNISELKREFYKQTPSSRIMIDYNYLTFAFNYLREKLRVYRDLFNEALKNKEAMMQQQKGGAGRPTGKPQHHSICNTVITYMYPLTYDKFYDDNKHGQIGQLDKKFQDLHKDLGNPKNKDCYKNAAEFVKLFNIYKQYWLFANHVTLNLSQIDNTSTLYAQCRKNLEIFKEIEHYLSPTITTYPWVPDLQEYIAKLFKKIDHPKQFGIQNQSDFDEIKSDTLEDKFQKGYTFASGNNYNRLENLVQFAMQNKSSFVGFEEYDSTLPNTGEFKKVYKLLNQPAGYNPNQAAQQTSAATSTPQQGPPPHQLPSFTIETLINKLTTMQANLENNYNSYMSADEYETLIKEYLDVLKLHDNKIPIFDENIKELVNKIERLFNSNSLLDRAQLSEFNTQIRIYNAKLQKLLNLYTELKNRGYSNDDVKKAVTEVIDAYQKEMSLGLDYHISSILILINYRDQTKLPQPIIQQPQQPPQGQQDKGTSTVMEQEAKKEIERENLDIKYIPHVLKRVKQISNDRKAKGDNFYEEQFSNLTNAFEKIKALFVDIVNSEGPTAIKAISDKLQTMTLLLLDLKYIEPTVTGVKVAGYKPTMLPGADWIVKTVDKDFDKEHKLTGTSELQELIKSNRDLAQIYRKITIVDDGALNKLFEDLLFELNPHKLMTVIRSKPEYLSYLGNIDNLKRLIEIIKGRIPVSPDNDKKKRVCGILATLENLVGSLDKDKIKVIADAKLHYDSGNPNNPCVIKDEKKKDDKKDQQKQGQQQQQGKRQGS